MYACALDLFVETDQNQFFMASLNGQIETLSFECFTKIINFLLNDCGQERPFQKLLYFV